MNLFQTLSVHFNWSLCFPLFLHLLILSVTSRFFPFQKSSVVKGTSFSAAQSELIISFKGLIALSLSVSLCFSTCMFCRSGNHYSSMYSCSSKYFSLAFFVLFCFVFCSAFCPSLKLLFAISHLRCTFINLALSMEITVAQKTKICQECPRILIK